MWKNNERMTWQPLGHFLTMVVKEQFGNCQIVFSLWFKYDDPMATKSFSLTFLEEMIWWSSGHFL